VDETATYKANENCKNSWDLHRTVPKSNQLYFLSQVLPFHTTLFAIKGSDNKKTNKTKNKKRNKTLQDKSQQDRTIQY